MTVMNEKETVDKKNNVLSVLTILFPHHKVVLTPRSMVFSSEKFGTVMVDETNFESLQ